MMQRWRQDWLTQPTGLPPMPCRRGQRDRDVRESISRKRQQLVVHAVCRGTPADAASRYNCGSAEGDASLSQTGTLRSASLPEYETVTSSVE